MTFLFTTHLSSLLFLNGHMVRQFGQHVIKQNLSKRSNFGRKLSNMKSIRFQMGVISKYIIEAESGLFRSILVYIYPGFLFTVSILYKIGSDLDRS